jgi:hypothetical protein
MSNNNDIYNGITGGDLAPPSGGNWVAELYVQQGANFVPVPSSTCPVNAGFFFGPANTAGLVALDGSAAAGGVDIRVAGPFTYEIKVWNTTFGATFEIARINNGIGNYEGSSVPYTEDTNPAQPPFSQGLNFPSFSVPAPEPATWTLGVLGAAPLLAFRRRR